MDRRGLHSLAEEMDMNPFELNVLDKRRTFCEKIVSLIRFSFEDDAIAGVASKIRHFYDLFYLLEDKECLEYFKSNFPADLIDLIAHDKSEFDRPRQWRDSDILLSPLFTDFNSLWMKVSGIYNSEVGALSYGKIPASGEILESLSYLFDEIKIIISNGQNLQENC